jgi:esterase/lipase superfamily enzyme
MISSKKSETIEMGQFFGNDSSVDKKTVFWSEVHGSNPTFWKSAVKKKKIANICQILKKIIVVTWKRHGEFMHKQKKLNPPKIDQNI